MDDAKGLVRMRPLSEQVRERRADTDLMPKKKTQKRPRVYRDAATGRFVTKKYAKKHPKRTVKEPRTFVWAASADDRRAAPAREPRRSSGQS